MRWLQRLMDDGQPERHPIPDSPNLPLEARVQHLECHVARLWDQVWWLSLPLYRRLGYRLLGFTPPITRFYLKKSDGD